MAELISIYSRCVVQLNLLCATKISLGTATGILISTAGRTFLFTNYHVLTGKHPYTDKMLDDATPDFVEVIYRVFENGIELPGITKTEHPLYDENHNPKYLTFSPTERRLPVEENGIKFGIDVACLEVSNIPHNAGVLTFDRAPNFLVPVMERVGIVGFPFNLSGTVNFPIWLTGTVASDLANRPYRKYFLVDARTRPSCSGSLVLLKHNGASHYYPGGQMDDRGNTIHTLGIYSGRPKSKMINTDPDQDQKDTDIGIVWQWNVVEELLEKTIPLPQQTWKKHEERTGVAVKMSVPPPTTPKRAKS